jgi:hypothetical protein
MRWLVLLVSLPPTPTRHRVGVWRKLKRMGAINLRGSAWILPDNPETTELFHWLVQEVQSFGGEATLLRVEGIETMSDGEATALFDRARIEEYQVVKRGCREILARLDRLGLGRRGPLDPLRAKLEGLKRELDRIQSIDYFRVPVGAGVRALWETTAKRLRKVEARPAPAVMIGRRRVVLPPPGSTWVTRPRPHIDRLASAWLIRRFLDPKATFGFADRADAAKKGVPFDVLGAEFGHHGEDCTFETLVKRFGVKDRRLRVIAEIVHEADLHDGKFARTEAHGIDLAVNGLVAVIEDDHELLDRGMTLFEGLYATLKQKT